jgi:hypothetical protein
MPMKIFLGTTTAVIALVLSIPSAQAQYQGSDEARGYAQSWGAATGGYSNGYYRTGPYGGAYARRYLRY